MVLPAAAVGRRVSARETMGTTGNLFTVNIGHAGRAAGVHAEDINTALHVRTVNCRSKLQGRSRAASSTAGHLVAAGTRTRECLSTDGGVNSNELNATPTGLRDVCHTATPTKYENSLNFVLPFPHKKNDFET